jgi:replication initiation and membrane attachment protein DnaB
MTIDQIINALAAIMVEGREIDEKRLSALAHSCLKISALNENPERELLQNLATFFFNKRKWL